MTTPSNTQIEGLIERVRAATGPDRETDWRIAQAFDLPEPWPESALWPPFAPSSKFDKAIPHCTASIDAALALVDRVLPGALISLTQMLARWQARILVTDPDHPDMVSEDWFEDGETAPLAILSALLQVLKDRSS
jgi:hypothetical protein